ncbi:PREDICTED: ankyrin repeat and LEM domain-containing protein 1 [Elephantulus edwardii]|uniref:ankyrin repeat and LEM domain-containing protein 1 n=1 Tax=Elephantulus edwardii TaxID=28737 RepID=UPI0003F07C4F|nr:PREDICTED: ankyrin repeat and LEM domain-containing protein 1 [Elephantulus edwardii]
MTTSPYPNPRDHASAWVWKIRTSIRFLSERHPGSRVETAQTRTCSQMWTRMLCYTARLGAWWRGSAAHARWGGAGRQGPVACGPSRAMGSATGLAKLLRAALRAEEPRDVEELLQRGADPNLVLPDGVAAIHLAAGARRPRGLRCLGVLLRCGGDPNARSAEALTPLHVAAAWGCRHGLELLLSQGADPALRDQDGLRALDLAEQQGHRDCERVLRELGTRTWTPLPSQEPEAKHSGKWGLSPDVNLDFTVLQTHLGRGDNKDSGSLEAASEQPTLPLPQEAADKDSSSEASLGLCNGCSGVSFVTAVEASVSEDLAPDSPPGATSMSGVCPPQRMPKPLGTPSPSHGAMMEGREVDLNARLQALTLASSNASGSSPRSSTLHLAQNPRWEPSPGPSDFLFLTEDQTSQDSDVAALWLTEDEEPSTDVRDYIPTCWRSPAPSMSDLELLRQLRALGQNPGPITSFTRPHYLRRLEEASVGPGPDFAGHSPELAKALKTGQIPDAQADEDALAQQFERPDPARKWREGIVKSSFTYLLLDPRETQDLPGRAFQLTPAERFRIFVRAIFYVGKGTRARPDAHLWEALGHRGCPGKQPSQACPKVQRILDIWASGHGVVSLHCFQHVVAVEAYTREACLVDALGIQMLTNQKQGHCYGVVAGWPPARRRSLGVHLLYRALLVFLAEGERELRPQDIQARG